MSNLGKVLQLVKKDILNSKYYYRMFFCFLVVMAGFILMYKDVIRHVGAIGVRLNVFEPALNMISVQFKYILLMGALLFLVGDAPYRDKGDYLTIYRVGRVPWLVAKIAVMVYYIILFIVAILLASVLVTLPVGEFSGSFSAFARGVDMAPMSPTIFLGETLLRDYSLSQAVIFAGILYFLWNTTIGMIIVNSNLKYKRSLGIVLAFIPSIIDKVTESLLKRPIIVEYVSLSSTAKGRLPITLTVMIGIIFLLVILAVVQIGRHSMNEKE